MTETYFGSEIKRAETSSTPGSLQFFFVQRHEVFLVVGCFLVWIRENCKRTTKFPKTYFGSEIRRHRQNQDFLTVFGSKSCSFQSINLQIQENCVEWRKGFFDWNVLWIGDQASLDTVEAKVMGGHRGSSHRVHVVRGKGTESTNRTWKEYCIT